MLILFTLFLANANNINIMTYTLQLTPYLAAMLDAACRATGLDTLNIFPSFLNRHNTPAPTPNTERKAEQDAFRRAQEEAELARYLQPRICPDNRLTATGPLPEPEPPAPVDETAFFNL